MAAPEWPYEIWGYNVVVDATHDGSIVVTEDGTGPEVIDLDHGTYSPSELVAELQSKLNAASGLAATYVVQAVTPTRSTAREGEGLAIIASGGGVTSLTVAIDSGAAPTRPSPEDFLGYGSDVNTIDAITNGAGNLQVSSPYTRAGLWCPREQRVEAEPRRVRDATGSTSRTERADFYAIDYGSRDLRAFLYDEIPAGSIWRDRGAYGIDYATVAEIAAGDTGAALEWLWLAASRGDDLIVDYYGANQSPTQGGRAYQETVRIDGIGAAAELGQWLTKQRLAGEFYQVAIPVVVTASDLPY